ncbi:MAG: MarR family transcriptional regulator [Emticicia sp.]|nr:MarR family transcriptional regulator [Emticicia sp.]
MQDVFSKLGPLIVASRLKRMSDYIMRAGAEFYRSKGIEFEPKWFPLYYLLSQEKELGIMEIAQKLNISHPAVIQLGKELEKKGWITSTKSKEDARKRLLKLSKKGLAMLPQLQLIWDDIGEVNRQVVESQPTNILQALAEMEAYFVSKSYTERMKEFQESKKK